MARQKQNISKTEYIPAAKPKKSGAKKKPSMPDAAEKIRRAVVSKQGVTGTTGRKISGSENAPHEKIEPGTVIGVNRGLYKHYGIYAGRSSIIHYASRSGDFGDEMSVRKTGPQRRGNFFRLRIPRQARQTV